ncbi:MAG: D-alanyl-D-alanine carboxypeptidase family protein [Clostridium sp.]
MKVKIICLVLSFIIAFSGNSIVYAKKDDVKLNCHAAVVIDQYSKRVLYGKNHNKILAMASTTKIITAIVAIENSPLTDKVTISKKAASVNGSSAGLKEGEVVTLEELVYGLMMKSGNDAAVAIAEHVGGGSVENFIALMNKKVVDIGLFDTHFVTPHGLDASGHETTAKDLAIATAYALKNPVFQRVSSCREIVSGESGEFNRGYNNINKFLFKVKDADGVKTGYTGNAGKCLVASIKHPHGRYIAVTLNSGDRWRDCENLVNYARDNFTHVKIPTSSIKIPSSKVLSSKTRNITPCLKSDIYFPVRKGEENKITITNNISSKLTSPIKKGEVVGNISIEIDGRVESFYPLLSCDDITHKIYK